MGKWATSQCLNFLIWVWLLRSFNKLIKTAEHLAWCRTHTTSNKCELFQLFSFLNGFLPVASLAPYFFWSLTGAIHCEKQMGSCYKVMSVYHFRQCFSLLGSLLNSQNLHSPAGYLSLFFSFYRWGNGGLRWWMQSAKVTQLTLDLSDFHFLAPLLPPSAFPSLRP